MREDPFPFNAFPLWSATPYRWLGEAPPFHAAPQRDREASEPVRPDPALTRARHHVREHGGHHALADVVFFFDEVLVIVEVGEALLHTISVPPLRR